MTRARKVHILIVRVIRLGLLGHTRPNQACLVPGPLPWIDCVKIRDAKVAKGTQCLRIPRSSGTQMTQDVDSLPAQSQDSTLHTVLIPTQLLVCGGLVRYHCNVKSQVSGTLGRMRSVATAQRDSHACVQVMRKTDGETAADLPSKTCLSVPDTLFNCLAGQALTVGLGASHVALLTWLMPLEWKGPQSESQSKGR